MNDGCEREYVQVHLGVRVRCTRNASACLMYGWQINTFIASVCYGVLVVAEPYLCGSLQVDVLFQITLGDLISVLCQRVRIWRNLQKPNFLLLHKF